MSTGEQKRAMRAELRGRVAAMSPEERDRAGASVRGSIVSSSWWAASGAVLIYASDGSEPNLDPLIGVGRAAGKRVGVCGIDWERKVLLPREVASAGDLIRGRHGVRVPGDDCPVMELGEIGLVLVPGVGFDGALGRLGRGGGFYDRFVGAWRAVCPMGSAAVGVGFGVQVVDRVPSEAHDAVLDGLVTDAGVLTR